MIVLMLCTTTLVQKISDSKKLSHDRVLLGVFLISGLGVFAHNMIDYNLQFVGITLPMILMMACSISSESSEKKYDGKYPAMILMLLSILLGSVTLIEGIFLTLSSIERHGGNAYYSESKGMWAMNPEYMNVFNNSVQYSSLFPRDYYLTLFVKARSDGGRYGLYEPLEEYAKKNNEDYRFWKMRCILFAEHGIYNRDEALSACQKAYEQGGKWNDAEVVWRYASALASSMVIGEFEKEYRFEFDTVLNEYAYAILQNSHFIALGENVENTIKLAETLKSIFYPPNKGGPNDWYDRKTIPEDENAYNLLIQEIKEHAKKERSHLTSREERIR
jgi:hypothetical protein